MDMIQCAFLRNEAECTEGYLLTDEEVEARLRGLGNMRNVDEAKLEKSVHNASALSRPLLEKLEQNDGNLTLRGKTYHVEVPQRVKQAVIPVLAVGLYYGIDSGTVGRHGPIHLYVHVHEARLRRCGGAGGVLPPLRGLHQPDGVLSACRPRHGGVHEGLTNTLLG